MKHPMKNKINRLSPSESTNIQALSAIKNKVKNKKVLFIATTYRDYLRIQQEILLLKLDAKHVYTIVSNSKSYLLRLIYVYLRSVFFFKKVDVVFIGFAPQLVLPFLKWRFINKHIIIDFFISLYDTMVMDRKKFSNDSLMSKVLKYFDELTLRWAHVVISDTQQHANYFINDLGCNQDKVYTLYLNADKQYYHPKTIKKPAEYNGKYIVLYFGTVLPLQGTDVILKAINLCHNINIFYIMVGPLDSSKCTNKNVKFINWLSQEELSNAIAYSDLCLAGHFCEDIDKASRTIPGKAYIYEAMNKQIILGDNKANRERYPDCYNAIKFVKMGSPNALHEIILQSYLEFKHVK